MKFKSLILLFFLFIVGCGQQEAPGAIYGKVTLIGGMTSGGATVKIVATGSEVTTDEMGNFVIYDIPVGAHTVRAEKPGYLGKTQIVAIASNDIVFDVEFELVRLTPPPLPEKYWK